MGLIFAKLWSLFCNQGEAGRSVDAVRASPDRDLDRAQVRTRIWGPGTRAGEAPDGQESHACAAFSQPSWKHIPAICLRAFPVSANHLLGLISPRKVSPHEHKTFGFFNTKQEFCTVYLPLVYANAPSRCLTWL